MKSKKVGERGFIFTFEDPYKTNVYIIDTEKYLFICDTFLGNRPMEEIMNFLRNEIGIKTRFHLVFNSHYDYDHVWGNGYFKDKNSLIFSHQLCRKNLLEMGDESLEKYKSHKRGRVELTLPNLTFTKNLIFNEENLEFSYTPGHTNDSSSCYDAIDKSLFVGDNIEFPFPYIRTLELDKFIETLSKYLDYDVQYLITGHTNLIEGEETAKIIKDQLNYVKNFNQNIVDLNNFNLPEKLIHLSNLKEYGNLLQTNNQEEKALIYFKESLSLLNTLPEETKGKVDELHKIKDLIVKLEGKINNT
ncbi:MAG: MBL fold metallo-hydrolase [Candidatus Lokiarchaeota archaeon]